VRILADWAVPILAAHVAQFFPNAPVFPARGKHAPDIDHAA
jgi:hypothetical protein